MSVGHRPLPISPRSAKVETESDTAAKKVEFRARLEVGVGRLDATEFSPAGWSERLTSHPSR